MGKFGTLSVLEDLATVNDPVAGNEDDIAARFQTALDIHNALVDDMLGDLALYTDQAQLPYGGADAAIIQEVDEWGTADASKAAALGNLGLPLRNYESTVQWTRLYFERTSVATLATQLDAHAVADIQNFHKVLRAVIFRNTNTTGYIDRRATKLTYDLKALLNADGQAVPTGLNGTAFDGATHTHYLASTTLTATYLQTLIDTVVEHGVDGEVQVFISKADEATVRGLTGFSPYLDARVTVSGANQIGNQALDVRNPDNRAIGVFGGAEIWVKPWIPANYQVALDFGGAQKPLAVRTITGSLTGAGSFRILAEHEHYPLRARHLGREFGIGVVGRHKGAVGRSNNAAYSIPVF